MCLHSAVLLVTSPVSGGPLPELHYEAVSLSRGQGGDQVSSRNAPWGGGPFTPSSTFKTTLFPRPSSHELHRRKT